MTSSSDNQPQALTSAEFATLMTAVGPFERAPQVAVAVSGGRDSLAVVLLVADWARAQGGRVIALTVDHGLRPESTDEARQVAAWMARWGIEHQILANPQPCASVPQGDVQAYARDLRYGLLEAACLRHQCLHLVLAQHAADQAETVLLRLARGSGVVGLAAMSLVTWRPAVRLLRPLLTVRRERLEALLREREQGWIEDPSNQNRAYARVVVRQAEAERQTLGLTVPRLCLLAQDMAATAAGIEDQSARLAAGSVSLSPLGWASLSLAALREGGLREGDEAGRRVLAGLLTVVGGQPHPPRRERLASLWAEVQRALQGGELLRGTLHRCQFWQEGETLWLWRESRFLPSVTLDEQWQDGLLWDGRFRVWSTPFGSGQRLAALAEGWSQLPAAVRQAVRQNGAALPFSAFQSLPAVYDGKRLHSLILPTISWSSETRESVRRVQFWPQRPLESCALRVR